MARVYCPKCCALTSDRAYRCTSCGRRDPGDQGRVAIGMVFVAGLIGTLLTVIYSQLVQFAWHRWLRVFGGDDPEHPELGGHPDEAAVLFGAVVFIVSSMLAYACMRPSPVVQPGKAVRPAINR